MFFLTTIADTLRIPPSSFSKGDSPSIVQAINAKYPRKVIMDVGMCIALYDVIEVGSSLIHPADGGAHFEVVFRVVVFKPFVGEVVNGRVSACTKAGIEVSLDFFDSIKIPYYNIFQPNHFDEGNSKGGKDGRWVWDDHKNDEDGDAEREEDAEELAIEVGDLISFVVDSIHFTGKNYSVKGVHTLESTTDSEAGSRKRSQSFDKGMSWEEGNLRKEKNAATTTCEMEILGSIKDDGLGKPEWWEPEDDEDDEDEEEEEDDEEGGGGDDMDER